jgi:hypothetical protein
VGPEFMDLRGEVLVDLWSLVYVYIYRYINTLIFTPLPSHRQFFPNLPGKAIPLLGLK